MGGVLADEGLEARRKHEALSIRISVGREHLVHDVKGMSDFCQILRFVRGPFVGLRAHEGG